MKLMVRNQYLERQAKMLLLGESVQDERFARVLRDALRGIVEPMPKILEEDAVFVVAKEVAELAKGDLYDSRNLHGGGNGGGSGFFESDESYQSWKQSDDEEEGKCIID